MSKKIYSFLENIFFVCLAIPYGLFLLGLLTCWDTIPLFPHGMLSLIAVGFLVMVLELTKVLFKVKVNPFVLAFSFINAGLGTVSLILLYAAVLVLF